jgi:hypothetical protein
MELERPQLVNVTIGISPLLHKPWRHMCHNKPSRTVANIRSPTTPSIRPFLPSPYRSPGAQRRARM